MSWYAEKAIGVRASIISHYFSRLVEQPRGNAVSERRVLIVYGVEKFLVVTKSVRHSLVRIRAVLAS